MPKEGENEPLALHGQGTAHVHTLDAPRTAPTQDMLIDLPQTNGYLGLRATVRSLDPGVLSQELMPSRHHDVNQRVPATPAGTHTDSSVARNPDGVAM